MNEVQKLINPECNTPLLEPFRTDTPLCEKATLKKLKGGVGSFSYKSD
jgi:hypothetical protein